MTGRIKARINGGANVKRAAGLLVPAMVLAMLMPAAAGCGSDRAAGDAPARTAHDGPDQVAGQIIKDVDKAQKRALEVGMQTPPVSVAEVAALAESDNAFAVDLFGRLRRQPGNLFFSPLSISAALAMTYAGARGETAAEIAAVMHFPEDPSRLHPAFKQLQESLLAAGKTEDPPYELDLANRLWGQRDYEFRPEFLTTTRDFYGAELALVDFAGALEPTRQGINAWVAGRTKQKILDLIPQGALGPSSRLVLTNAIYFHGKWARQFKEKLTRQEPFWRTTTESIDMPMMRQSGSFAYAESGNVQMLELPYRGGELAFVILLPKERDGLAELERVLTCEDLGRWLAGLQGSAREVDLTLPKFKLTSSFELADVLRAMGMRTAFTSAADFSGMASKGDLQIDRVIHKAFVDVQEEGTEAAAATAVTMRVTSVQSPVQKVIFRADHPFLFLIRDLRTGSILFLGRLADPSR
jgi:serpin B